MFFLIIALVIEGLISMIMMNMRSVTELGNVTYTIYICIDSIVLFLFIYGNKGLKNSYKLMLIGAYIFRILLMIWDLKFSDIFLLPNAGFDDMAYYYKGMGSVIKGTKETGYVWIVVQIFKFYGISKMFGQYINVLISMSSLLVIERTINKININDNYKTTGMLLACFLPNFAILSALLLRESLIIFFLAVATYYFTDWWYADGIQNIVMTIIASLLATWLHSGVVAAVFSFCIIFAVSKKKNGKKVILFDLKTVCIMLLIFISALIFSQTIGKNFLTYLGGIGSAKDVVDKSQNYVEGGSAYNVSIVNNNSMVGLLINSPVRILYFILAPMPWDWRGINDVIAFALSGCFYGYTLYIGIKAYRQKYKNKYLILSLLLIAFTSAFIFSWGVSNAGTALRHRDKFVVIYILLFAIGLDSLKGRCIRGVNNDV